MLESVPASVMTYWLASNRLQDPTHRNLVQWQQIEAEAENQAAYNRKLADAQRSILRGAKGKTT